LARPLRITCCPLTPERWPDLEKLLGERGLVGLVGDVVRPKLRQKQDPPEEIRQVA